MATREEDFVTRIFIANTHTPVLFFSSRGMAYKMTVWRLPLAAPQARGKALVNLLPLDKDETITTILPLPEDEASWEKLDVMFATNGGTVRRNKLSDFIEVRQNGKIAMKLEGPDRIVGVQVCNVQQDVLLTTAEGQAIRFPVSDVRVFKGRESAGVRGIKLEGDDQMISMAILNHVEASPAERTAYVRQANSIRRGGAEPEQDMEIEENGEEAVVASFPVEESDQIMLVTDGGQLIRVPVEGISVMGRSTQGVIVFTTAEGERVVSVEHIPDENGGENGGENDGEPDVG
jgi:DNA gyrase subunit A